MKKDCTHLINHISRLQGQINRLQQDIDNGASCESVVQLALSASKSFDALRSKIIENYIEHSLLKTKRPSSKTLKELQSLYTLIKA